MILKAFETHKINLETNKFLLLYGNNEGAKLEVIKNLLLKNNIKNINSYDEKEILENQNNFLDSILSKSLFEKEKVILIKRVSEKLTKLLEILTEKKIDDTVIILNSNNLDKKSKLRLLFEKNKNYLCIPFYPDNEQSLAKLAFSYFKEKKISISTYEINLIVNKCNGDRKNLFNELEKIENFCKNGKKITESIILKLVNLSEDFNISELIDNCLAKNSKKTVKIFNENNFNNDDCILITRVFLNKSKKILKLCEEYEKNNNIDLTISSANPPIFWKDKEIVKQQILSWKPKNIKNLIYKINEVEMVIKKNFNVSINVITDFILTQTFSKTNN